MRAAVGMMLVLAADKQGIEFIPRQGSTPEMWKHRDGTVLSTDELEGFLIRKQLDAKTGDSTQR